MPTKRPTKRPTGGPVDPGPAIDREDGPELITPTTTACIGADNCAAKTGHWNRLRTLDGTPTTHSSDGIVWNRKCPADGCPIRTYR